MSGDEIRAARLRVQKAAGAHYEAQDDLHALLRETVEPCRLGTPGFRGNCHRGGIGCSLLHEADPPEFRYTSRRVYRKRWFGWEASDVG